MNQPHETGHGHRFSSRPRIVSAVAGALLLLAPAASSWAALASLKTVPVPEPLNLGTYVASQAAAIQLGKALFWDMQVGSDGVQACGTCHFHAGADNRTRNTLNPGMPGNDTAFGNNLLGLPSPVKPFAPNVGLSRAHFPLHKLIDQDTFGDPALPASVANVVSDCNDVVSSMGVELREFVDVVPGDPVELSAPLLDPVFTLAGTNIRRVAGRNAPSVINAVFNFSNFWDGRANNIFNGENPFGPADPAANVFVNKAGGVLATELARIRQSSLASQAVGPPLSDFEMSWQGRTWPKLGKKMLSLQPLAQQLVHPQDSVLGPLANASNLNPSLTGLKKSYLDLIKQAFRPKYWSNTAQHLEFIDPLTPELGLQAVAGPADPLNTNQFTQMEANFSLFFGLAVQLYEATLVADDSPFDKFMEGSGSQTLQQARGMATFNGSGGCAACHGGAELIDVAVAFVQGANPVTGVPQSLNRNPLAATEFMAVFTGSGLYDNGYHNTGTRPGGAVDPLAQEYLASNEDVGRGGDSAFAAVDPLDPLTTYPIPLSLATLGMWKVGGVATSVPVPASLTPYIPPFPFGFRPTDTRPYPYRTTNFGAFKTPTLRNVELTGPYMHNGGLSTLHQVVEFYARGGDFPITNEMDLDAAIMPIGHLQGSDIRKNELVAFLLTLTDQRVKNKSAPFDHPEIFVPIDGRAPVSPGSRAGLLTDLKFKQIPAVGGSGLPAEGLPPLGSFLSLNPFSPL